MLVDTDDIARSLTAVWGLVQRDSSGLRQLDTSRRGLKASFAALGLIAPAFVIALAAERERLGLLVPGSSLADDPLLILRLLVMFAAILFLPPLLAALGLPEARSNAPRASLTIFTVASNWSAVLEMFLIALPAYLLARGLSTPTLTGVYLIAFGALIAHLRWFTARHTLHISGATAACLVGTDLGLELALGHALALA